METAEMKTSKSESLVSIAAGRGWLNTLQRWVEAMDFSDHDLLDRRIHNLELKISELQSRTGIAGGEQNRVPPDAG